MRAIAVILVLGVTAGQAAADPRTRELAKGYDRELTACQTRVNGVTRVVAGTQALIDDGQKQYETELATLRTGLAQLQAYCSELTATLEILNADPGAAYRTLERKLDEQDNKIRKLRQTSKKVADDLAPVTARMIPVINARVGAAAPATKKVTIKFASGRAIDAPVLAGTYRSSGTETTDIIEYDEARQSATITVKLVASATCEQQRQAIAARDAAPIAPTDATSPRKLAWYVAYGKPGRKLRAACRTTKAGAVIAMLDEPAAADAWPELEPVLLAMIAARP